MRRFLTAAVALGLLTGTPQVAWSATYDVHLCTDDPTLSTAAAAASNSQPDTLSTSASCLSDPVAELDGIAATDRGGAPNTPSRSTAQWTLTAASGTTIASLRARRFVGKRDNSWNVWLRTDTGQLLDSCEIVSTISCSVGALPANPQSLTTYTGLNANAISWGVTCRAAIGDCPNGLSLHNAWVVVYAATVTINDPAPPQIQPIAGAAVEQGRWHGGVEQVSVASSDASGNERVELLIDGAVRAFVDPACDYSRMQPCPAQTQLSSSLDMNQMTDGLHQVVARATDAAGQTSSSAPIQIGVDTKAPAAPIDLSVSPNDDGTVTARWRNPDQGTGAPITAAHFQFCPLGSDAACAGGGILPGDGVAALERIRPPAGASPWDLVVWLQDAAGHADRAAASRRSVVVAARPPGGGGGERPSPGGRPARAATRLRLAAVGYRAGKLRVRGTLRREVKGRVVVALRRTRRGRAIVRRSVPLRAGRFSIAIPVRRSKLPRHGIVTAYFSGSSRFRAATVVRTLGRN